MVEVIPMAKKRSPEKATFSVKEFKALLSTLKKESDRGMVLITAALMDDLLEQCIRSFLIDHRRTDQLVANFNGPLGSLGARILAAFSLGILSESEYQDCERVRKVRNSFAHGASCSFKNEKVNDICWNFSYFANIKDGDARGNYLASSLALLLALSTRPAAVSNHRLKHVDPK